MRDKGHAIVGFDDDMLPETNKELGKPEHQSKDTYADLVDLKDLHLQTGLARSFQVSPVDSSTTIQPPSSITLSIAPRIGAPAIYI